MSHRSASFGARQPGTCRKSDETTNNYGAFIWSVADLLRGVYKQSEYGRVILPLTVLRRLDCVLEPTKEKVLERADKLPASLENQGPVLEHIAGQSFYNTSKHTFMTLLADPDNVAGNLRNYIAGFSESAHDIIVKFNFDTQVDRLHDHNLLYRVVSRFADLDMSPEMMSSLEMGYIYEELIRRFSELSNETAGEHFTPREVIRLMVNLLFVDDDELLTKPGIVKTMLDRPAEPGACCRCPRSTCATSTPKATSTSTARRSTPKHTPRAGQTCSSKARTRRGSGSGTASTTTSTPTAASTTSSPTRPSGSSGECCQPRQVRTQDQRLGPPQQRRPRRRKAGERRGPVGGVRSDFAALLPPYRDEARGA